MQKWEYLEEKDPDINRLNELGKNGWELVQVLYSDSNIHIKPIYVFKRPLN